MTHPCDGCLNHIKGWSKGETRHECSRNREHAQTVFNNSTAMAPNAEVIPVRVTEKCEDRL